MNSAPPPPRDQRRIDSNHLDLLSIFHFVGAGLGLFGILFLCLHYTIMHAVFMNPKMWQDQKQGPPPAEIIAIFQWFYVLIGAWFLASLILNVISGFCLRARKGRTFSLVVAGINCLHIPVGTTLGVFTSIVLMRDSIQERYAAPPDRQS